MKLELKHLDFVNNNKIRLFNNLILYSKDVNLQDCKLGFDGNKEPYLTHQKKHYYLDEIKPYKRSLSQLTQEIEHDGVRFVPFDYFENDCEDDYFADTDFEFYLNEFINPKLTKHHLKLHLFLLLIHNFWLKFL